MYKIIILAFGAASEANENFVSSLDTYSQTPWFGSWDSDDPLNETFPTNESIVEVMYLEETPWDDGHHHSSFLLSLDEISTCMESRVPSELTDPLQHPILVHEVLYKGNMGNISATIPIDISVKIKVVNNVHIGASCSLDEIKIYTNIFK